MAPKTSRQASKGAYTFRDALQEAHRMLDEEFGEAQQDATVQLATVLYSAHSRDEFLKDHEGDGAPYGGTS